LHSPVPAVPGHRVRARPSANNWGGCMERTNTVKRGCGRMVLYVVLELVVIKPILADWHVYSSGGLEPTPPTPQLWQAISQPQRNFF
jgi:hypothetical protein